MEDNESRDDVQFMSQPLLQHQLEDNKQCLQEDNSQEQGNASFFKTFINGLNALSGIGILSISYALASGGWLSLLLLFSIALASFYSGLLIKRCMEMDSSIKTYPDIGKRAFGRIGKTIAYMIMNLELYLVVTGFLISEGDNLHKLFPQMEFQDYGLHLGGKECFIIIVSLVILPTVLLDNLSILSYISATGVIASVVILVSVLYLGAFDGVGFHYKGEFLKLSGIPTAVSLYGFCYSAHPVFPTLYNSMKKKHHFTRILVLSFVSTTICYTSMAIFGYLMFGSTVDSQITLELPTHKLSSKVAIYTTLVNPLSKYALMIEPVARACELSFPSSKKRRHIKLVIRTLLVATQVLVALAFPFFGIMMALVGALLSVTASIILPCLFYLKISGTNNMNVIELILIVGTLFLGVLIAVLGTYTSLKQVIQGVVPT